MPYSYEPGRIGWIDLTVPDAQPLRDFYAAVTGWRPEPVDMGGYNDFTMLAPEIDDAIAGICNAQGMNANLPPVWLLYIVVADLGQSLERCRSMGGTVIGEPRGDAASGQFAIIEDPAGAFVALVEAPSPDNGNPPS